jgi:hypothetical protein
VTTLLLLLRSSRHHFISPRAVVVVVVVTSTVKKPLCTDVRTRTRWIDVWRKEGARFVLDNPPLFGSTVRLAFCATLEANALGDTEACQQWIRHVV